MLPDVIDPVDPVDPLSGLSIDQPPDTVTEYIAIADPELLLKLDLLSQQQEELGTLIIFVVGLIGGIFFMQNMLKGWLDG